MSSRTYIGTNIKYYRKTNNLTQKELAASIGKTESSIQKYEAGKVEIPMSVLEKIAEVLNVNVFEISAKKYEEFRQSVLSDMKSEAIHMFRAAGYTAKELESGDFELIHSKGSITIPKHEFDTLYLKFCDFITYTTDKYFNEKQSETLSK